MKKMFAMGLAAAAVAVPVALAAPPATKPVKPVTPAKPVVSYLLKGSVQGVDSTAQTVTVSPVKGTNAHARRALGTKGAITVKLGATTKMLARVVGPGGTKTFVPESLAELKPNDVVFVHIRAKKGSSLETLEATVARWVRDLTPNPVP